MVETKKDLQLEQRLMLDTIYDALRDRTPTEITEYLLSNPTDTEFLRDQIPQIGPENYNLRRLQFLHQIREAYLS